jgi:DnaK suppressor protein
MTREEMEEAKAKLERLRQEVLQEVSGARAAALEYADGVPDIGELSANTYSRDLLLNLSEVQRQKIRDIDAALERIARGAYGICVRCEEPIEPRRLAVRPFSRYCIDCKTEVEKFGE